jgi:HK97 family phage portal protein
MGLNIKSIPIEAFPSSYWRYIEGKPDDTNTISPIQAFHTVPVLHRAVTIRAKAVASMPYIMMRNQEDITAQEDVVKFLRMMRPLMHQVELHLCLYGRAYLLIERNRFGLNGRLRCALPTTIEPEYNQNQGLTGFVRRIGNKTIKLGLNEVIYIWMPSVEYESGYGQGDAQVAMRSASTLYFLDQFLENFWRRGAIKATLLSVAGPAQQAEMEKLENWWKRFVSGVRNAWNTVAIRADVKPIIIGDTLKDTVNPDLTEQARTDTLTALGVPHSLVLSNAATYATAKVDTLSFYENTIVPQCRLICDAINEQLLEKAGLHIEPRPDKLETYQRDELEKAQGIMTLVGSPVLTVDEARDMMGYAPMQYAPNDVADKFTQEEMVVDDTAIDMPKRFNYDDLQRWKQKSIKSIKRGKNADVSFVSDQIEIADQLVLRDALKSIHDVEVVHHVFEAFKKVAGENVTEEERPLYERIRKVGKQLKPNSDIQESARLFANGVVSVLKSTMLSQLIAQNNDFFIVDPVDVERVLQTPYNNYLEERRKQLYDSTYKMYQGYVNDDLIPPESMDLINEVIFGDRRSEVIAVTEFTNIKAYISKALQDVLEENGMLTELIWNTAKDELVCLKCRPLNKKRRGEGWDKLPPAHPFCRCEIEIRRTTV